MNTEPEVHTCQTCADPSQMFRVIGEALTAHADRDGLTGVRRAVFMARGGHAPGTVCPTAGPIEHHDSGCAWFMGEACDFGCTKRYGGVR